MYGCFFELGLVIKEFMFTEFIIFILYNLCNIYNIYSFFYYFILLLWAVNFLVKLVYNELLILIGF